MAQQQQVDLAFQNEGKRALENLKTEWGQAHDQNWKLAERATKQFVPAANDAERGAILTKIERAMGTEAFVKMFARIGEGLTEHKLHGGGEGNGLIPTPAQARQRIAELMNDKDWSKAYTAGDKNKLKEMTDLHALAYSTQP